MLKNKITVFVLAVLVAGSLFLAFPETGSAQFICCQVTPDTCIGNSGDGNPVACNMQSNLFQNAICGENTGQCISLAKNVPTLSEWGLIAMAGVLGIVGFMVIRRKRVTA